MRAALSALAVVLALAGPAAAQDESQGGEKNDNPFFASAIPEDFPARFTCHQAGQDILALDNVRSFAPKQINGVMTFSLITGDGVNHLIYLGGDTTCGLSVTPPGN